MNPFIRWCKFNAVGALGMAVQLAALALFNRVMAGHYLYASAAAIELTLIHNFLWHRRYTWRDRRAATPPLHQFIRFQLSNGLISLLGNLILMRLFIHTAHFPLLAANLIAIATCSIANFFLGNHWAFAEAPYPATLKRSGTPAPPVAPASSPAPRSPASSTNQSPRTHENAAESAQSADPDSSPSCHLRHPSRPPATSAHTSASCAAS